MSRAFIDGGTTGTQAVATGSAKVMPLMPMITEGASDPSAPSRETGGTTANPRMTRRVEKT